MASSGFQGDVKALQNVLGAKRLIYQHQHNEQMSCAAVAQLLYNSMYFKRFFPYGTPTVLASFNEERDVFTLMIPLFHSAQGSGAKLILPLLDNQLNSPSLFYCLSSWSTFYSDQNLFETLRPMVKSECFEAIYSCPIQMEAILAWEMQKYRNPDARGNMMPENFRSQSLQEANANSLA